MSGSGPLAPLIAGVTVCDLAATPVTTMTARLLADLGAGAAALADADIVLASEGRDGGRADSIWVSVTPFGLSGPRSSWRASDLGVMASSGNLYCTGDPDRAPVRCAGNAAYAHTGSETAFAALTALASGVRPLDVDVSMQEVVLVANMGAAGRYFRGGNRGRRLGANIGRTREIWPTKDGWVSCGLRGGKARLATLETLAKLVGDPALIERDWTKWDPNTAADDELREVERLVGGWFAEHTTAELYDIACETNIMLAPVNSPRELYASAQLAARDFFDPDGTPRKWAHFHIRERSAGDNARSTRATTAQTPGEGAWSGTRILEFGAGAAGPIATRYFAEHGATVLRVESGSRPDFLRIGQYADMFDALNCGKRSVTLNLKHPDGHALAKRLITEWADAVQENFAPRAMRGLGLSYDGLVADKPDLVMISACLNGQTGPHRDYPGFGGQGAALSGFNYLTGWPDREPIGPYGTITDSLAPRFVATALAGALLHHRATGNGVYVDLSQVECAAWTLSDWLLAYQRDGVIGERLGNGHPTAVLHGVYPCAVEGLDRWVAIACWSDDELARLRALVGDDLEAWTRARDMLDVATELQAAGSEAVPVQDFGDVDVDPQVADREHWVRRDHPELGPGKYERNGVRLGGLPSGYDRGGPTLGQDNGWALGDLLGLSRDAIARFEKDGVLN